MAKLCEVCNATVTMRGPRAKYCSVACKEKARPTFGMDAARYKERQIKRLFLDEYKLKRGCETCGYREHPAALTLDHIDPATKCFTPSHGITRSWKLFILELEKCRVLCANCHNIHTQEPTYGQRKEEKA